MDLVSSTGKDYHKAMQLKEEIEDINPLGGDASMFSDILGAGLGTVNWLEIIRVHAEDLEDEDEDRDFELIA